MGGGKASATAARRQQDIHESFFSSPIKVFCHCAAVLQLQEVFDSKRWPIFVGFGNALSDFLTVTFKSYKELSTFRSRRERFTLVHRAGALYFAVIFQWFDFTSFLLILTVTPDKQVQYWQCYDTLYFISQVKESFESVQKLLRNAV